MAVTFFPTETALDDRYRLVLMRPEHLDDATRILVSAEPWRSYGYDFDSLRDFLESSLGAGIARAVVHCAKDNRDDSEKCVGVLIVHPGFLGGRFLEILALHESHRKTGLGRRIIRAVCSEMPDYMRDLFALVAVSNIEAFAFYKKCGFKNVGDLPGLVFNDKIERLIWLRFK